MKTRLICFAAVFIMLIASLCPASAMINNRYPEDYQDAKNSVARLYAEYECEYEILDINTQETLYSCAVRGAWIGSGIAVGNAGEPVSYFLTNRHVVSLCHKGADFSIGETAADYMEFVITDILAEPDMYRVQCVNCGSTSNQKYYGEYFYARIPVKRLDMYVIFTSYKDRKHASIVMHSDKCDIGIVKLDTPSTERIPATLRAFEYGKLGNDKVYALGFPAISDYNDYFAEDKYNSTLLDMTVTDGIINLVKPHSNTGAGERIQHTAKINHGNSGGALVDAHGYVLGVNNAGWNEDMAYGMAVSINEAIDILNAYGIPYIDSSEAIAASATPTPTPVATSTPTPEPTATPTPTAEPTAVPTAEPTAVPTAEPTAVPTVEPTAVPTVEPTAVPEPEPQKLSLMLPIIIIAAVLIGGGVTAIILLNRKNKRKRGDNVKPEDNTSSSSSCVTVPIRDTENFTTALVVSNRVLRGETGALTGKTFEVTTKKYIGCDATRCQIVCPQGTPGVSRVHCSISFENGAVIVRDEGSSYGTFVGDKKLEKGQSIVMHRGQHLYLGSKNQSLVLLDKNR